MEKKPCFELIAILQRKILFYKICLAVLIIGVLVILIPVNIYNLFSEYHNYAQKENSIPHYGEIMKIMRPLKYSGLKALVRPEVNLTLDFQNGKYYIHNLHRFNSAGEIILDNNSFGLCGELAAYVFKKINPLLGAQYKIGFLRVLESGFFATPRSSHIILKVTEMSDQPQKRVFYIDPSFHKYGSIEDFDNYLILEDIDALLFDKERFTDVSFPVDVGPPILIENDYMVALSAGRLGEKFDKNNFSIYLIMNQRYKFTAQYLLAMVKNEGRIKVFENKRLAVRLLGLKQYEKLRRKIAEWLQKN